MATKYDYTHYVIFAPTESAGIYTSWNRIERLVKNVRGAEYLAFWSKKQAEVALAKGYEEARRFKQRLIDRGEDKPAPTIDPQDYILKW